MTSRRVALNALTQVLDGGAYANLQLKNLTGVSDPQQGKWIHALVYTTLDHLLTIDYYLAHYLSKAPKSTLRNILRLGVCELLYFGTPAHAAINGAVSLTKEIGKAPLSGFVNGVLRRIDREREHLPSLPQAPGERLSIRYSYPLWLVTEWMNQYGEAFTERLLSAPAATIHLRAQYPFSTDGLLAALPCPVQRGELDDNCLICSEGFDVAAHPLFLDGSMTVQNQGAMLICRAMGDCRNLSVLDVCAAPGGKSAYLASLGENKVALTCFELHENRKAIMEKTFERLHVKADAISRDACLFDPVYKDRFDGVLIDAPCSGLGLLGDKPDIRYSKTNEDLTALAQTQRKLLDVNARYVRPGGVLLYATCTISRRENEGQIERFLSEHPDFVLERMPIPMENGGMLQLFPCDQATGGFFMARMRRKEA